MSSLEALANLIDVYLKHKEEPATAVSKELSHLMINILGEMLKYYDEREKLNESKDPTLCEKRRL